VASCRDDGIALNQAAPSWPAHAALDGPFHFQVPRDWLNVQRAVDDDQDVPDHDFEAITACTRLHFVSRKTGKLLGEK
jgi:hypothetical protein